MKYLSYVLILLLAFPSIVFAGNYLGQLGGNQHNPNSSSNSYGAGNPYNQNSINNPYSQDSPSNPYGNGLRMYGN